MGIGSQHVKLAGGSNMRRYYLPLLPAITAAIAVTEKRVAKD